ncbi:MAG: type II secretion system protein [Acidimicrobiales bacterium]
MGGPRIGPDRSRLPGPSRSCPPDVGPAHRSFVHQAWPRGKGRRELSVDGSLGDQGFTLVELLVAFAVLLVLFTVVGTAINAYMSVSNNVIASYNTNDQILPTSIVIQRLIRSEVEPAPVPTASNQVSAPQCPVLNAPCPPFVLGSVGTTSATFYANVGILTVSGVARPGPAKIVMSESTPTKCGTCAFYTSQFTVTEQAPDLNSCPFSTASTLHCTYTTAIATMLVNLSNVVNGQANLLNPGTPIFTYNTLDPYSAAYVPGNTNFGTSQCQPPTVTVINSIPTTTASNCPADNIQSVGVDLQVLQAGSQHENYQENSFVVYRLSSASSLYRQNLG